MNWTDKFYNLRTEAVKELKKVLEEKDYDKSELSSQDLYELPYTVYTGDLSSELFSIYMYDKEDETFLGKGWNSNENYFFTFDELDTQTICNLIDLINESV